VTRELVGVAPAAAVARPARGRWLVGLAVLGALLFTAGLLVELRCGVGRCPPPAVQRLFDLDGIGSLPRQFTTAVFAGGTVLAAVAARRSGGRRARWWVLVAAAEALLTVAKAVSTHSAVERQDGVLLTFVGGLLVALLGLAVLWRAGLRWGVPGASLVSGAFAAYAVAALGLDRVTGLVAHLTAQPSALALAVYLEEGGEAVAALALLAAVVRSVPRR